MNRFTFANPDHTEKMLVLVSKTGAALSEFSDKIIITGDQREETWIKR